MANGSFGISLSCIDGRVQKPISKWIQENYSVDYIDTITEPGMDKVLTTNPNLESIKAKAQISIDAHKSELIVVSGHYTCAANPVSDDEHIAQIKKSVQVILSWGLNVKVVGVWVDSSWNVVPV